MNPITRKQREALLKISNRIMEAGYPASYRTVRKSVMRTIGMDGAIAVPFFKMFLLIETDGYCHS
jgi:hypothetical protein